MENTGEIDRVQKTEKKAARWYTEYRQEKGKLKMRRSEMLCKKEVIEERIKEKE